MTKPNREQVSEDKLDLLITFFKQEKEYAKEILSTRETFTALEKKLLKKRIEWIETLIGLLKETKTKKGVKRLKEAIERETRAKAETGEK